MKLLLLLSYDIADDKGRAKMAKQLEQYGFERLQYSVFAGHCRETQWKLWRVRLAKLFEKYKQENDKFYVIPQSERMFRQTEISGLAFDMDWVTGKTLVLYI